MIPVSLAILVAIFLAAPLLVIVPMSFSSAVSFEFPPPGYSLQYYENFFNDPDWLQPALHSVVIAAGTTVLTMTLMLPAAYGFVRYKIAARSLANLLFMLPLIVPHVVSALAYYGFLAKLHLVGTIPGMIIAHSALATPVAFLVVSAAFKGFDRNLEHAGMSLGAGPLRTFLLITMPVLKPGMLVGALFAFLSSFNEAVVAIFIAGRNASTLPKKMFESIRLESDPVIAVVSTLLTGAVLAGTLIPLFLRRRRQA